MKGAYGEWLIEHSPDKIDWPVPIKSVSVGTALENLSIGNIKEMSSSDLFSASPCSSLQDKPHR